MRWGWGRDVVEVVIQWQEAQVDGDDARRYRWDAGLGANAHQSMTDAVGIVNARRS